MEGTLYDWAQEATAALGLPEGAGWVGDKETVQWVLDFSKDVSQAVVRPAAPVGAFLAGVAIGRSLEQGRGELDEVRSKLAPTLNAERS
jgi:Domain of unknown function (DUF6457)